MVEKSSLKSNCIKTGPSTMEELNQSFLQRRHVQAGKVTDLFHLYSRQFIFQFIQILIYTANVYRELQGLYREIGVQGFQIYGDCMYTRNPCNFSVQVSMQILLWKNMYTLHVISLKFTGYPCKFCMDFSTNQIITWFPYI